ncbi:hypothetical protein, partial [Herbidospora sp. RD11066]
TLQKMSSEMFSQPTSIMNVNQRNPSPNDGVVHHALAFSTLLSSQETHTSAHKNLLGGVFNFTAVPDQI